jgi:tetratricopeptide (TPR) repeat protein
MIGVAELQQGRNATAAEWIGRALDAAPGYAEAECNLGVALRALGRVGEAEAAYRRTLELLPDHPEAHLNLGRLLRDGGRLEEAAVHIERAVALQPGAARAHLHLGILRRLEGRPEEAAASLETALALTPGDAEAWNELGATHLDRREIEDAVAAFRQAVALRPAYVEALTNLGAALRRARRLDGAEEAYGEALRHAPERAETHANLGVLRMSQGRVDEAILSFDRAIALRPGYGDALWNRANALLLRGDFARGWDEYEARWQRKEATPRDFPAPAWEGESLAGRTLLVHAEQGLGDTIQFVRYLLLLEGRAARIVLEVQEELAELLSGLPGVDAIVARGKALPAFDAHAALLSLPRILRTRLDTIPAGVRYLAADPALERAWGDRLGPKDGVRIGLVWAGNPKHSNDHNRSAPAAFLPAIAGSAGCRFFSLQMGERRRDLLQPGCRGIVDLAPLLRSFADTAAALTQMDLCIAVDTSVAHLAGALGRPTWVALPFTPDWRWLMGRDDSPWYPTMRLFRQTAPGDWNSVTDAIHAALRVFSPELPNRP